MGCGASAKKCDEDSSGGDAAAPTMKPAVDGGATAKTDAAPATDQKASAVETAAKPKAAPATATHKGDAAAAEAKREDAKSWSQKNLEVREPEEDGADVADEFHGGHAECRADTGNEYEFAKTHPDPDRWAAALKFLTFANENDKWRGLVPKLIRVQKFGDRDFMVLENLMGGKANPVIADFKLGTQSWMPGAKPEKIAKMKERDAASTTGSLGLRVTSVQLPQGDDPAQGYLPSGRVAVKKGLSEGDWRRAETQSDVHRILHMYLRTAELRAAFIEQLKPYITLFEEQSEHLFIGSSLFLCYDHTEGASSLAMRLIDFGNSLDGQKSKDEGVLKGLLSLKELAESEPSA